jgi:MFS family permease
MRDIVELFSNTRFRALWFARIISNIGNGMAPIALSFGILELPGASAKELGYVLTGQAITIVVMLPFGGVIADRYPRAALVAITDLIGSIFVMAQGILFITGTATWQLIAINHAIFGILAAIWWPAFPGIVPAIIKQEDWNRANAVLAIANNGGMIFGAAIAGALVTVAGPGWALFIDGVSFVVAGALVWTLRTLTPRTPPSGQSVVGDLLHGFGTFMSFRWVWVVVAAFSVIVACMRAGFDVSGPVLFKEQFNGAADYSVVQTLYAIGFLVGALIATKYKPQRPLVFCLAVSLSMPLQFWLMSKSYPVWILALGAFLVGISFEQWGVNWGTALQTHIPRESLSRVSAFDAMGSLLFGPVGLAVAGPLIAAHGVSTVLLGSAVITLVMLALPLLEREVRELRWIDPEPATEGA